MWQYLLIPFFFFVYGESFGQSNVDKIFPKEEKRGLVASIFGSKQLFVYNNSQDTISLSSINPYGFCSCSTPKIISAIQIDGRGAKEIVFYRKCKISSDTYLQSFNYKVEGRINKYEVWNLDTKQLLFEAKSFYKIHFEGIRPNTSVPRFKKGKERYKYKFRINEKGVIRIKNIRGKNKYLSDNKEGLFEFVNGKYELKR